ncbi:MAG: hypothetical protein ACXVRI_02040, partial [Gaiellaceae bacterium]
GPGLSHALTIEGFGEGDSTSPLGILVTETGFFPQAFEQTPSSTTRSRPADRLGPRYDVKYTVPGGSDGDSTLRQVLYPYAVNGPASYMAPGQKLWGTQSVPGGWYRGSATLKGMLVKEGLPATAPRPANRTASGRTVAVAAGAGVAFAAGALVLLYRRRRSTPR